MDNEGRKQEGGLPHGVRQTEQVSEIGDCRKKTRKQVPVTTRRPAFYFYGTRTQALALALADPSRIAALSGEMAAEFNFSDMHGCL